MLLRRGSREKAGIQRRSLLVAYYDETSADSKIIDNTLSPLKRQLNQIAIASESTSKRQLMMTPADKNTQNEDSNIVGGLETATLDNKNPRYNLSSR
ncbi:hypothetical protein LIER_38684 [Lithospermum erythrorhizon]|uniref:Uncharacterized protein n=1 Tax=Lithospermum erythrorhizon TaxID=34254 RepID=A0AAV3Q3C1_LITER